jgi:hypothetical protein
MARSDELLDWLRESAVIGNAAAWPDWQDARCLSIMSQRYQAMVSDEVVKADSGYASQEAFVTCVAGQSLYPMPDRSIGGTLKRLDFQPSGQTSWTPLEKLDVNEAVYVDQGNTKPGVPRFYDIQDGFIELFPTPGAAYVLRVSFFIRPSYLVTQQSSLENSGTVRGLITGKAGRTVTVNAVPLDMLASGTPAITSANQRIDIVHPAGTFALAMYSQPQTLAGSVFTLGGTDDMTRVQVGDFVRVAEQSDWPNNLPVEYHRLVADRGAMEVARSTGRFDLQANLALTVEADQSRWRATIRPQAKNAPKAIPIVPYYARGRTRRWLP